jgi:hypothetical protein
MPPKVRAELMSIARTWRPRRIKDVKNVRMHADAQAFWPHTNYFQLTRLVKLRLFRGGLISESSALDSGKGTEAALGNAPGSRRGSRIGGWSDLSSPIRALKKNQNASFKLKRAEEFANSSKRKLLCA